MMKKKIVILFLISSILLITINTACAENNDTTILQTIEEDDAPLESINEVDINNEKLEKTVNDEIISISNTNNKLESGYYYDSEYDDYYEDNTIIAKDITMYYGQIKYYSVTVLNDDKSPANGVEVFFGIKGKNINDFDIKTTNYKGIVSFPMNYGVGTHKVMTMIIAYDDDDNPTDDFWFTYNTIKIKSTIPTKTLKKSIKQKNKKFSIKFLNSNGKILKNKKVKIKVKGKTYTIKTNTKGIAKIKINSFKRGKHSITAINSITKEKRKITVTITK